MMSILSKLLLVFTACLAVSVAEGVDSTDFKEDSSSDQGEDLEWPEVTFPKPEARGSAFRPGESFSFRAQWGVFRKAGVIEISTSAPREPGKIIVETESRSSGWIRTLFPMWLKARTVLDAENWRVESNVVEGEERNEVTKTETTFDYIEGVMRYTDEIYPEHNTTRTIPYPFPLDYASSLLQLRGWDLEVGKSFPLLVSSKAKFYYIRMAVVGKEEIGTQMGKMEAFRLEPTEAYPQSRIFREGGEMAIWVSADDRRIPLRFDLSTKIGTATLRLTEYTLNNAKVVAER